MSRKVEFREKLCGCGCGRVGHFHTYASDACRQRAYRNRKKQYTNVKSSSISTFLIDIFGYDDCVEAFSLLNEISGQTNIQKVNDAIESLCYLFQAKLNKANKRARRVE